MNRPNTTRIQTKPLDACVLPNQSSPGSWRLTGIHTDRSHARLVLDMLAGVFLLQLDLRCAEAYPDLPARYWRLVDRLNAEPLRTRVFDPSSGQGYDVAIDGHRLLALTDAALHQVDTIRDLPLLIAQLEGGQVSSSLRRLMMSQLAIDSYLSPGMSYAVQCREGVHYRTAGSEPAQVQELTGALGNFHQILAQQGAAICETLGVPAAPPIENQPVVSAIPTLLLAGAYDPATPAAWAHLAAETLSASQTVEFPGAGHALFFEFQCARNMVRAFFDDPGSAVDSACVDALPLFFRQR